MTKKILFVHSNFYLFAYLIGVTWSTVLYHLALSNWGDQPFWIVREIWKANELTWNVCPTKGHFTVFKWECLLGPAHTAIFTYFNRTTYYRSFSRQEFLIQSNFPWNRRVMSVLEMVEKTKYQRSPKFVNYLLTKNVRNIPRFWLSNQNSGAYSIRGILTWN